MALNKIIRLKISLYFLVLNLFKDCRGVAFFFRLICEFLGHLLLSDRFFVPPENARDIFGGVASFCFEPVFLHGEHDFEATVLGVKNGTTTGFIFGAKALHELKGEL